jgi:hypothetical protein
MKKEEALKRLAIVKYLYNTAVEQSVKPEPLCLVSVLTFHDSIELFLELAAEHLDRGKSGADFMAYWDLLAPRVEGGLAQKESCRQLNTARVGLKHSGVLPAKLAVEGFRATATNFFEENTPKIFDIGFSDVSLIGLIQNQKTREKLEDAMKMLRDGKIEDALDRIALAFTFLVDEYESSKKDEFGRSPFFFGKSLTFLGSFNLEVKGDFGRFVDRVKESIEALQDAVKILSLGFDYRRYARFRLLTPVVFKFIGGNYEIQRIQRGSRGIPTPDDVQFCVDFTIESALALQEFDFALENGK